jgi:uncharacterized protein (DUF927 family)
MDTLTFLKTILPEDGFKFVGLSRAGKSGIAHKAYESLELMAQAIDSYDKQPNLTIYHACCSYKEASYQVEVDGEKKTKYRGEPNWKQAKSFWADIDCGEQKAAEGKGYATKQEAAKVIIGFCRSNGFPEPMLIDSGGGIHCYWPLTRNIGPKSWRTIAVGLKAAFAGAGLIVDPTRTADLSSVLRPVGSHNRKPGRDIKAVKIKTAPNPVSPEEFSRVVTAAVKKYGVTPQKVTTSTSLNDDLISEYTGPKFESSAHIIAENCQQMAKMRDTKGDVDYETWRGLIGVIKHCVEGRDIAHEWSEDRGDTGHSNTDTDTRYDSWSTPPASCDFFEKSNPTGCEGCPFRGKINNPIVLGRIEPTPQEEVVEVIADNEVVEAVVPALPETYKYDAGRMLRYIKDKDGILQPYSFCQSLFYPIQRIRKSDGTFAFTIRMHLPDKRVRDFEVDTAAMASSSDMLKALAKYELMPTNNKDSTMHMTAYIKDSIHKLMTEQMETDTLTSFGWRENMNGFLLGDRLYHTDGSVRKVFIGGYAAEQKKAYPVPRGTLTAYSEAVNFIYSRPSSEAAQYAYCNGYGSLLSPFAEDSFNGALVSIVSNQSGKGKTTVCKAALYGIGDANNLIFAGKQGATRNARWALVGVHKNIPIVFDEMTDTDPGEISDMSYTISQGTDRARLTSSGGKVGFAEQHTWKMSPWLTANEDMYMKLASHNANTQAEAVRMMQINFVKYNVPIIDPTIEVSNAVEKMRENWGNAGDVFIRYIVTHQSDVSDLFFKVESKLSVLLPESEYRFFRSHAACTLTAAKILIDLGIVAFDYDKLVKFTVTMITDLVDNVVLNNTTTPGDGLNRMFRELSNRILVTNEYRDLRADGRGPEDSMSRIQGTVAGRRVLGSQSYKDTKYVGKLFLAKKEVSDWCSKNRLEPKELIDYAAINGWITVWPDKFNMGRGTIHSTGSCSCYVFDYSAMEGAIEKTSGPVLVKPSESEVASIG